MGPLRFAEVVDAARLRAKRRKLGKTLRQVAMECGKPAAFSFIGQLERGEKRTCSPELAYGLLNALHIEPEDMHLVFRFRQQQTEPAAA